MKAIYLFALGAFALAGCKDDTAGSPPPKPMTETQMNNQINAIQNNPAIPAQGKEMAIRQIKAAYEMMKSQSQHAGKKQASN